jgi:DNA-binding GntR family transcriptional regulator
MQELPKLGPAARIVDAVHTAVRQAILSGALAPGEPLSVPELSRRLDVSRSPVREAVLQLVSEGLAVEQPRKGVVVATINHDDLLELHEIREFVEALSARLCAERIDDAGLARLHEVIEQQKTCVARGDETGYFETNIAFHAMIGAATGNARLRGILSSLEGQMRIGLRHSSYEDEQHHHGLREHEGILAAIGARDPDRRRPSCAGTSPSRRRACGRSVPAASPRTGPAAPQPSEIACGPTVHARDLRPARRGQYLPDRREPGHRRFRAIAGWAIAARHTLERAGRPHARTTGLALLSRRARHAPHGAGRIVSVSLASALRMFPTRALRGTLRDVRAPSPAGSAREAP